MQRMMITARTMLCARKWSRKRHFSHVMPDDHEDIVTLRESICREIPCFPVGSERECDNVIRIFRGHGFTDKVVREAIIRAPRMVELSKQINDLLCVWRGIFKDENNFLKAIGSYPELLYLKPSAIETRRDQLLTIFPRGDIMKLMQICPRVLVDEWEEVLTKIDYVVLTMGIKQEDILKSKVLSYSLPYIKVRHLSLLRCGVYKTPKEKDRQNNNPPLKQIFDTPTGRFIQLAGLTQEEFEVFEKMVSIYDVDELD
ncbi:uncharacterized protein LOC135367428 [Ornithodoros turicata]|uniref:uncharacterized protein LOC135367428 n=1 Tax=Ornithodoros turicata TaxID=34597 RepID=UPI0031392270